MEKQKGIYRVEGQTKTQIGSTLKENKQDTYYGVMNNAGPSKVLPYTRKKVSARLIRRATR